MTIETKLKELEDIDKAATPGPWEKQAYMNYIGWSLCAGNRGCVAERWYPSTVKDFPEGEEMAGNMNLISAYRNETPKLIAALREAVECLSSYSTSAFEIDGKLYRIGSKADKTITRIEKILGDQK